MKAKKINVLVWYGMCPWIRESGWLCARDDQVGWKWVEGMYQRCWGRVPREYPRKKVKIGALWALDLIGADSRGEVRLKLIPIPWYDEIQIQSVADIHHLHDMLLEGRVRPSICKRLPVFTPDGLWNARGDDPPPFALSWSKTHVIWHKRWSNGDLWICGERGDNVHSWDWQGEPYDISKEIRHRDRIWRDVNKP
ncbi:MAG: hypothetical protein QM235_12005 [Pseudomonadota bacterium]|nr:hypothetical protein [Pseudomonadota bacterium]